MFDTAQRKFAIDFCRTLLAALKASTVNNACFEEESKLTNVERALWDGVLFFKQAVDDYGKDESTTLEYRLSSLRICELQLELLAGATH